LDEGLSARVFEIASRKHGSLRECRFLDNDLHFLDSHLCDLCSGIEIRAMALSLPALAQNNKFRLAAGFWANDYSDATSRHDGKAAHRFRPRLGRKAIPLHLGRPCCDRRIRPDGVSGVCWLVRLAWIICTTQSKLALILPLSPQYLAPSIGYFNGRTHLKEDVCKGSARLQADLPLLILSTRQNSAFTLLILGTSPN
jgi:hypothetical protein